MPVCRIVVILIDTDSDLICYLKNFVVRRNKAEPVWHKF